MKLSKNTNVYKMLIVGT